MDGLFIVSESIAIFILIASGVLGFALTMLFCKVTDSHFAEAFIASVGLALSFIFIAMIYLMIPYLWLITLGLMALGVLSYYLYK